METENRGFKNIICYRTNCYIYLFNSKYEYFSKESLKEIFMSAR